MTGSELKSARTSLNWTQAKAAHRLGVTQAYLSMLERGSRPVSPDIASSFLRVYSLSPTARPLGRCGKRHSGEEFFKKALGELGYPGFAYLKSRNQLNPAELLFAALDSEDLDSRVAEALPWLPYRFPAMNWGWLMAEAKLRNRQNRLAYVIALARDVAADRGEDTLARDLESRLQELEPSRLANEDTFCEASLSRAERKWLRSHRTETASHWNLLTDLKMEGLQHVY